MSFTAKTQEIIDALARIPKHEHRCDKAVIKLCFDEHSTKPEAIRYAGIWLPFLKARDAGLWLYWVTADEVVCCASPSIHVKDDRLHCDDGPAVSWPDSPNAFWYLKGVQVTEDIVRRRFGWRDIDAQSNAEVRRIMLELYGEDRYVLDSGIAPVHTDEWGTLYRKEMAGDEPIVMVKVVNCTPEPNGTYADYWIRCDPNAYGGLTTARAAVASTWRTKDGKLAFKTPEAYCPVYET